MQVIERLESEVRAYCRDYPTVFDRAQGAHMYNTDGQAYLDFFSGAGTLNYGHNNPTLKAALLEYLERDGIVHSLDMTTAAKVRFLETFEATILKPRGMQYKVQFPGPTGTNAVEAALKLARKVTGRETVIGFTNAFHGMTLGSLSVTGNGFKREGAGVPLHHTVSMPYDGFLGEDGDTLSYLEAYIVEKGSGVGLPAAIIVETVQGEGGLHVAEADWLRKVESICRENGILLIVDDIQAGCGRTGTFFSFEEIGLDPDMVCLSKSISGYGLPMALTLIRPELDQWAPGEHNATFRGHNPAFVTATKALETYWSDDTFAADVRRKAERTEAFLKEMIAAYPELKGEHRGRGMMQGIAWAVEGVAKQILAGAYRRGLVMETSGVESDVTKLLPPLSITDAELEEGFGLIRESIAEVAAKQGDAKAKARSVA